MKFLHGGFFFAHNAKMRLIFFILVLFGQASPAIAQNFSAEMQSIGTLLIPFLSQLEPSFQKQIKAREVKKQLDSVNAKKIDELLLTVKKNCRLTNSETLRLLFFKTPVTKKFRFSKECDVNGDVEASEELFRVEFTLKNLGSYYRARYFMRYSATKSSDGKEYRVVAKIYDGELFSAEDKHRPKLEFIGDYAFVLNEKQLLVENTGGSIYLKTMAGKKIDRVLPLKLP